MNNKVKFPTWVSEQKKKEIDFPLKKYFAAQNIDTDKLKWFKRLKKMSGKSCTQVRFMLHCKCTQTVWFHTITVQRTHIGALTVNFTDRHCFTLWDRQHTILQIAPYFSHFIDAAIFDSQIEKCTKKVHLEFTTALLNCKTEPRWSMKLITQGCWTCTDISEFERKWFIKYG